MIRGGTIKVTKYFISVFCALFIFVNPFHAEGLTSDKYVQNVSDFKLHTSIHIQNVVLIGLEIFNQFKESHFKDVSLNLLLEKLQKHDSEKIISKEELARNGYKQQKDFSERLFEIYGVDIATLDTKQKESFSRLIEELNSYSHKQDFLFYRKHNLLLPDGSLTKEAVMIQFIERIADLVERSKNPISTEEFGRVAMMSALSFYANTKDKHITTVINYVRTFLSESQIQNIIRFAEFKYSEVVPANFLVSRALKSKPPQSRMRCEFLFN